ncbi:class I SAM-dependent RNA methyltransferase [Arcanobacterium ihumii]|uniref:class I SAM-dependent RNA methyltransferase n=1 Tax=Arcanobacterium ihumii TaxID=2138162 RepID=UPI000F51E4FC|nr:TRAM domain-containing protein [Arcanobacterium ihumii]
MKDNNHDQIVDSRAITVRITDIAHGGWGVGRVNDQVVFVRGSIPGELVEAHVTQARSKFLRAVASRIIEPSESRVEHPWKIGDAGQTGAADFGHIKLADQRNLKTQVLQSQIRRLGGEDLCAHLEPFAPSIVGIDKTDGWHWRTRIDLVKMDTGFGMYQERSHNLLRVDCVPLAVRDLDDLELFGSRWDRHIKPGDKVRVVSPSTGDNVISTKHGTYIAPNVKTNSFVENIASDAANVHHYSVQAAGFWQVHWKAPQILLEAVIDQLNIEPGMNVVDLYSGAGLFSVPAAKRVGEKGNVIALEGSKPAAEDAKRNLAQFPWAKVQHRNIDAEVILGHTGHADIVIADPSRSGLGIEAAHALASLPASRIALVSCDPAAMARDCAVLIAAGREVISVQGFDIFPNTHHFEVVTLFS